MNYPAVKNLLMACADVVSVVSSQGKTAKNSSDMQISQIVRMAKRKQPDLTETEIRETLRHLRITKGGLSAWRTRHKSLWELVRALGVLKVCSYDWLVDNSQWLLTAGERVLGRRLLGALVGPTFYRQFVGGATPQEMRTCVDRLAAARVRTMVACSLEDEEDSAQRREAGGHFGLAEAYGDVRAQWRESPVVPTHDVSAVLGVTDDAGQDEWTAATQNYWYVMHTPPVHLTRIFDTAEKPELIVGCLGDAIRSESYREYSDLPLESSDHNFVELALRNLRSVCQTAKEAGVTILVDAEYANMNGGHRTSWSGSDGSLQRAHPAGVEHDTPDKVSRHLRLADRMDCSFGVKLVRGAYMDGERRKAREHGEADTVCSSYQKTNENYDTVLCYLLEHIHRSERECRLVVATHNEDSIRTATTRMQELGLAVNDNRISFGQLLGMYDHITFPLAARGYNVYKSIPYGPLTDLLLYLARRASENRSVLSSPVVERRMLASEIRRRLTATWKRPLEPAHD
ncbi:hypothetical protein MTO96_031004 [Rhipicephalus appendiculatus]